MSSSQSIQPSLAEPSTEEEARRSASCAARAVAPSSPLVPKRTGAPDTAYRAWLGHTATCAACRVGVACAVAVRLGRVWRAVRRG